MTAKTTYRVQNKAKPFGGSSLDVEIYDVIGDLGPLGGGVTAQDVLAALGDSNEATEVNVRINSAGGSVTEGFAIFNLLREKSDQGAKVNVKIDGLAASIASIVALAGDSIEIADNAYFMIHNPFALVEGESGDLRQMADHLDDVQTSMLGIYASRTGLDEKTLAEMCDAETWLSADKALDLGFVDKVVSRKKAKALARVPPMESMKVIAMRSMGGQAMRSRNPDFYLERVSDGSSEYHVYTYDRRPVNYDGLLAEFGDMYREIHQGRLVLYGDYNDLRVIEETIGDVNRKGQLRWRLGFDRRNDWDPFGPLPTSPANAVAP